MCGSNVDVDARRPVHLDRLRADPAHLGSAGLDGQPQPGHRTRCPADGDHFSSSRTKTEAKNKLKEILRDQEDGQAVAQRSYTVADAVNDWLGYGLSGRDRKTITSLRIVADEHVIPALVARQLRSADKARELASEDVDKWLEHKAKVLSTSSLQRIKSMRLADRGGPAAAVGPRRPAG